MLSFPRARVESPRSRTTRFKGCSTGFKAGEVGGEVDGGLPDPSCGPRVPMARLPPPTARIVRQRSNACPLPRGRSPRPLPRGRASGDRHFVPFPRPEYPARASCAPPPPVPSSARLWDATSTISRRARTAGRSTSPLGVSRLDPRGAERLRVEEPGHAARVEVREAARGRSRGMSMAFRRSGG